MAAEEYRHDIARILGARHASGGDNWATADGRLWAGRPLSTVSATLALTELGVPASDIQGAIDRFWDAWQEDGRFSLNPGGAVYPCNAAAAARILCRLGYARDKRLEKTFVHLLETPWRDGGWRCESFQYGRGPETEFSNPGTTLYALDAFRFTPWVDREPRLDRAVESVLEHWTVRKPLGPCHYGIGPRFLQVESPMVRYNILTYVYVLSFYSRAKDDPRFREALAALELKLTPEGQMVVENAPPGFEGYSFCQPGRPDSMATARYQEVLRNLGRRA